MTMSKRGFTSGPWRAVIAENQPQPMYRGLIALIQQGNGYKAVVAESEYAPAMEWEANARLIAVAPDMHEVCRQLVSFRNEARRIGADGIPQWVLDIAELAELALVKVTPPLSVSQENPK